MAKNKPQAHIWFSIHLDEELDVLAREANTVGRAQAFATAHSIPFEESNDTIGVRDFRLVVKLPELLKVMRELNYEKIEHGTVDLYGIDEKDPLVDRAQYLTEESIVVMD